MSNTKQPPVELVDKLGKVVLGADSDGNDWTLSNEDSTLDEIAQIAVEYAEEENRVLIEGFKSIIDSRFPNNSPMNKHLKELLKTLQTNNIMGKEETKDIYPGYRYQGLFNLMSEQHGLTLLEDEMNQIINEVRKIDSQSPDPVVSKMETTGFDTLQDGDWFVGTEEQYRKVLDMEATLNKDEYDYFIEDCIQYGMVWQKEFGNGFIDNLTRYHKTQLTPEEFIRRAENTFNKNV